MLIDGRLEAMPDGMRMMVPETSLHWMPRSCSAQRLGGISRRTRRAEELGSPRRKTMRVWRSSYNVTLAKKC